VHHGLLACNSASAHGWLCSGGALEVPSLPPALLIQILAGTKRQQHAYHHSYFLEDDRL
jgi:hypothetical protein